jgi:hypothetical protein
MHTPKTIALVIGLGFSLVPRAGFSQAPAAQPAQSPAATPLVPPDQQPAKERLMKLFEVMRMRQQFDSMTKMMPLMVQQQVQAQMKEMLAKAPSAKQLTPERQAAVDKLMSKYMEKALAIYPIDEMIGDAATVYRRHVTGADVDACIAFYGSPAGQHLLDAQPVIMKEYMPMAMQRIEERSKELNAEMVKDMDAFIRAGQPASAGSAPSTDKPAAK